MRVDRAAIEKVLAEEDLAEDLQAEAGYYNARLQLQADLGRGVRRRKERT